MELSQLEILDAERSKVSSTCPSGDWPCGNCGTEHPVHDSWVITYRAQPFRDLRKTLVCDRCARQLGAGRPRSQPHRSVPRHDHGDHDPVLQPLDG